MVWLAGDPSFAAWLTLAIAALPMTATYAFSNIVFLVLLAGPIGKKLDRMRLHYGFFAF